MKEQNRIIDQKGKTLKRVIREDRCGDYVMHMNMKAYIKLDRVVTGDLVRTNIYKISYYI